MFYCMNAPALDLYGTVNVCASPEVESEVASDSTFFCDRLSIAWFLFSLAKGRIDAQEKRGHRKTESFFRDFYSFTVMFHKVSVPILTAFLLCVLLNL